MRKKYLATAFFILCTVSIYGMSRYEKDDIAIPDENYPVEITDIDGVITNGVNVTFNDMTVVSAKKGSTDVFIPFSKITKIELKDNENVITNKLEDIEMHIFMKDGTLFTSNGMSHYEVTGESSFGRFRIRLDRIRKMMFLETPPGKTD
ncbi:MAG: hypothetical protein WBM02_07385 [bacterium]